MKNFAPSIAGIVILLVGGVLRYNGAMMLGGASERELSEVVRLSPRPAQEEESAWSLDGCHELQSPQRCDLKETISVTVDPSESMVRIHLWCCNMSSYPGV
jgi:hypothetical protein